MSNTLNTTLSGLKELRDDLDSNKYDDFSKEEKEIIAAIIEQCKDLGWNYDDLSVLPIK